MSDGAGLSGYAALTRATVLTLEIVENLEAALEQLQQIANDLGIEGATEEV